MAPSKELAALALQKRLLRAEAAAQRLVLASEFHRLSVPVRWVERFQHHLRPLLVVGAPVAGFWLTRRSRGMKRWLTTGWGALRLLKTFRQYLHRDEDR